MKRILPLLLLLHAPLALADEHLVPEENQFTRANLPNGQGSLAPYYDRVLTLLGEAFTPEVRARVIAMPSDAPEYAVGIREREGAFSIFHIGLKTNIWSYETLKDVQDLNLDDVRRTLGPDIANAIAELKASVPADFRDVAKESCEFPIEAGLAERILGVWNKMLLATHFSPAREVGPAGSDYHFSMRGERQHLSGKAWEPPITSDAGMLVAIAQSMKNVCVAGDANRLTDLRRQVDALTVRLGG